MLGNIIKINLSTYKIEGIEQLDSDLLERVKKTLSFLKEIVKAHGDTERMIGYSYATDQIDKELAEREHTPKI
jgi:hypothetical protein